MMVGSNLAGLRWPLGGGGELEYCDPLKNQQYYEQNPYYTIVEITPDENDIQDDTNMFEKTIKEKLSLI
ncbi:hypothetical protein ES705_44356 [subsurface metagenome]